MANDQMLVTRALTLTQPWATLVAIGAKRRETRCWPISNFHVGTWIAIHAAKGFPGWAKDLCTVTPFRQALAGALYGSVGELPRGEVIAVARVTECIATRVWTPPPDSDEYAFGDYSAIDSGNGKPRYSFKLEDVRRLKRSMPCNGSLGIWRLPVTLSDDDLAEVQVHG